MQIRPRRRRRRCGIGFYRVGIIGIGDISDVYIENLGKYGIVKVVSCAARDPAKARAKAEQHGIPEYYASADELLSRSNADIILNLTPPAVHGEYNIATLQSGRHLYSEKPLAAALDEAAVIMELAERNSRYVGCAPDTFLGGRLQTCRRLIDDGTVGEVVGASAFVISRGHEWHHPNPDFFYQPGAGPLLDIGPYYVTALLALLGPVRSCCAMSSRAFGRRTIMSGPRYGEEIPVDVDTHITGSLEFAGGALATLITSFDVWESELPRIEIYGTRATICIPDVDPLDGPNLFGGPILLRTEDNCRWKGLPRPRSPGDWNSVPVEHQFNETSHDRNSRGIGLIDMAYAMRDQRDARAGGAMAYHSLETIHAMLTSARERRFVDVESTFQRPEPLPVDFPESES